MISWSTTQMLEINSSNQTSHKSEFIILDEYYQAFKLAHRHTNFAYSVPSQKLIDYQLSQNITCHTSNIKYK